MIALKSEVFESGTWFNDRELVLGSFPGLKIK